MNLSRLTGPIWEIFAFGKIENGVTALLLTPYFAPKSCFLNELEKYAISFSDIP